jgi:hypothetical protein
LASGEIPNSVRQFIFDHIDSVEQLEVLALLFTKSETWWTSQSISNELRSSAPSIQVRLKHLKSGKLIEENPTQPTLYRYRSGDVQQDTLVASLVDEYRKRRQSTLELIFSPLKKGRNFADAFKIKSPDEEGDENG